MARPKGVIQKRDESKYWLPSGVTLKPNQTQVYNKDTLLIFIDHSFGEFESSFKRIQSANASTHPDAVAKRRLETNISKYGVSNPSLASSVKEKRKQTMLQKFGSVSSLGSREVQEKIKQTNLSKYGVENPMQVNDIKEKLKSSFIEKYGVDNPMRSDEVKAKLIQTNLDRYGVENAAQSIQAKNNYYKTMEGRSFSSEGELEVKSFVESLGFSEVKKKYFGGSIPTEMDVTIPEIKVAIDYHGAFNHSEFRTNMYPTKHLNKLRTVTKAGYKCIQIFDFEWQERNTQVKSFLRSALGKNEITYYARDCEVREISKDDANRFLDTYHIIGKARIQKAYGLFYKFNNELVQVLTIGLHHRNSSEYVLNRFCGKENISVVGGLSKLCSKAKKDFGKLTTWIDLRHSNGESWVKAGWTVTKTLPPDYFYYNAKSGDIVSKQSRQKRLVGTPEGMTEKEHALADGLYRVWDCGKIKLEF